MEQLEGMIGTLRVYTSRLATKESYWIFHKDGDDFDLKVSDPKNPSYLLIANDPEMESIIGALNALILNRLVTRVNTGQGKNIPVSIIVDELPTLYFHKIDRLIGTARSNKVSVTLGFQELPQLEADYGKVGMQKIITTVGNVVSGSARAKETLEWLSNDIFGKVVQIKKGVTIDRDKTSINLNENMDSLVPASKISDMATGWICGQTARDFVKTKTGAGGSMWFRMPSRPAISCAEKARNGLQDGSGARNSIRFAAGEVPASGIRMAAERLRAEYTRLTGASKPGTRRW
jgi:hypothetical protein